MDRVNKQGKFNVPYGWYPKFSCSLNEDHHELLQDWDVDVCSFETSIAKATQNDFIFLDPPYDLVFKNYSNFNFDVNDHIRLSNYLKNCKAKWLMIINSSPFIMDLYKNVHHDNRSIIIQNYDTRYSYNIRGRNQRNTNHLLIKNY